MFLTFDPLDEKYKSVTGGVAENCSVRFFVQSDADAVEMLVYGDNGLIARCFEKSDDGFALETAFGRGLYFYKIKAVFPCGGKVFGAGKNLCAEADGEFWQLTVCPSDYSTPDFIKGGIIYQIFPDRFCRSGDFTVGKNKVARYDWGGVPTFRSPDGEVYNNEFFGGNFKGIKEKFDYLESLGVTAVYLNPVCESYSSHRYDTGDYMTVDPVLGSDSDLKEMLAEGEKRGIRFIFDGVFNHTGADSRYFNKYKNYDSVGAYESPSSKYFSWYAFRSFPDDYECWWNFKTLPSIKKDSADFQSFVTGDSGVLKHWIGFGFRGVRLDVADELTDDFIKKIRARLKAESADNLLIGEVWEDATNKIAYGIRRTYFSEGELDSVMNYPLKDAICDFVLSGNCDFLARTITGQINNYPKAALDCLMNVLSTHDSVRAITLFGRKTAITDKDSMAAEKLSRGEYLRGKARLKCASAVQFFLYGVPTIYYGDEEGLEGDLDPYNRRCFDWDNPDEELVAHYGKLAEIRLNNRETLAKGKTKIVLADKGLFVYSRGEGQSKLVVAANAGNETFALKTNERAIDLYGGAKGTVFEIKAGGFVVLRKSENE